MSLASDILKLFDGSMENRRPKGIILSADNLSLLKNALREIKQLNLVAQIVEGSTYFRDPPDSYRKDTRHSPQGMTHFHVFRHNNQMGVVNFDGSGHDGYSGTKLYQRQGDFLRDKGVKLPMNNVIASRFMENYIPKYAVIILETELLELLWRIDENKN